MTNCVLILTNYVWFPERNSYCYKIGFAINIVHNYYDKLVLERIITIL